MADVKERNSEGKSIWITVGVFVAGCIGIVADKLLGSGLLADYPTAVMIVGLVAGITKLLDGYRVGRNEMKNERERTKQAVELAKKPLAAPVPQD